MAIGFTGTRRGLVMKTYTGVRRPEGCRILVTEPVGAVGESAGNLLRHRVRHSPTGLEWGYGGSGPADTALSVLWDATGQEPPPAVYQAFKREVVAGFGDRWTMTEAEVERWMAEHWPLRRVCGWCQEVLAEGRRPATHGMCAACAERFKERDADH